MKVLFILYCFVLVCISCTTPYQPLGKRGGYTDEKINDHIYRVSFEGNTRTKNEVVYRYFLRRCAELAQEHKFNYFIIIDTEDKSKNTVVVSEGAPKNNKPITTFNYSGDTEYQPNEYKNITKHIIEGKIALFKDGEEPLNAYNVDEVLKSVRK